MLSSTKTRSGKAPQKTPTSSLNTWYSVPSGTSYWYVPYGATQVRVCIVGAGSPVTGSGSSAGGAGGGCVDVYLTVGASNGINENEELKLVYTTSANRNTKYTSSVYRSERSVVNAIGYAESGAQGGNNGTAGTQVTTGNGLTVNAYSGGTGGSDYVNYYKYVSTGGGGGGAGPTGNGGNGGNGSSGGGGSAGSGGSGNSSLPSSSGGAGGAGKKSTGWGVNTPGNPGQNYGGGSGGYAFSGGGDGGESFFRIYAS